MLSSLGAARSLEVSQLFGWLDNTQVQFGTIGRRNYPMKFHLKIWRLRQKRKQVINRYERQAAKINDKAKRNKLWEPFSAELGALDAKIRHQQTLHYMLVAQHLGVPFPTADDEDSWEAYDPRVESIYLTVNALAKIRSAIRQERKEFRETFIPIVAIIVSLLALFISFMNFRKSAASPPMVTPIHQANQE
jgi:hypothetical protein